MKKNAKIIAIAAAVLIIAGVIIAAVSIGNGAKVEVKRNDGQTDAVDGLIDVIVDKTGVTNVIVDKSESTEGRSVMINGSDDYTGERWNGFSADGKYEIPADGVDALDINWLAGGVEITLTDGDKITITESSKTELDEETALCWRLDGETLEVKYASRSSDLPEKFLSVELPKKLALKSAEISSVSGYISIDALSVEKELNLSGNSGSIKLLECAAGEVNIEAVSGDITLEGCRTAELDAGSVSGTMSLGFAALPDKLSAETVSGDVYLRLPADAAVGIEFDTVSGSFSSALACSLAKDSDYSVETVSGSLYIEAA